MSSTEKVKAEEIIDGTTSPHLVAEWINEARAVDSIETLQKLSDRLLSDVRYHGDTLPLVYTIIALAALKMANRSRHGALSADQMAAASEFFRFAVT